VTQALLAGIHDREGAYLVPPGGWCVDTIALSENPAPTDYGALAPGVNWIARLNWGYGTTGTIPLPAQHGEMAARAAEYVAQSRGCTRFIVGNEPNHSQEWPDGQIIRPTDYARAYILCRQAIKRAEPGAEVLVAAVAPWNVESRDWLAYWHDVLRAIGPDNCDGITIHAYIRAAEPGRVVSNATMEPPFQGRLSEFRAYRDTLGAMPTWAHGLPCYMTEANPLDGWQATGVMPAMLEEISDWNGDAHLQPIQCVCFYRYPEYDRWHIASKPDVIAEFRAVAANYPAPGAGTENDNTSMQPSIPVQPTPSDLANPAVWDPRLDERGAVLRQADAAPGRPVYRLHTAEWRDEGESGGRHHAFVEVEDERGQRLPGVPVRWFWPGGEEIKPIEANKAPDHGVDFAMFARAPAYGVEIADAISDRVEGLGLGSLAAPHHNIHTSYRLVFRRTTAPEGEESTIYMPSLTYDTAKLRTVFVTAPDGLNVRTGPGTEHERVTGIPYGAQIQVTAREGDWWHMPGFGWVHGDYLSEDDPGPRADPELPPHTETPPTAPAPAASIIDPYAAQAIIAIESGGQGFGPGGRLLIRFENHLFLDRTGSAHADLFRHSSPRWTGHEWRPRPDAPWQPTHVGGDLQTRQDAEWAAFQFAASLDREAALQAISMGAPQILGSNHRRIGYTTPEHMFQAFADRQYGMAVQMVGFLNYFLSDAGLFDAMRRRDFVETARRYNGPGQATHYGALMQAEYDRLTGVV
jgi:hypothetical protein